jgi:hypothetical protein
MEDSVLCRPDLDPCTSIISCGMFYLSREILQVRAKIKSAHIGHVLSGTIKLSDVWGDYVGSPDLVTLRDRWADILSSEVQQEDAPILILDSLFALDPGLQKAWVEMTDS